MSMRAVSKLTAHFGLVSVPLSLFKTEDEHGSYKFNMFHVHEDGTNGRIQQKRFCSECGDEVAYSDICKGTEVDEQLVIVTPDDLAAVTKDEVSGIQVEQFVPADEIPTSVLRGTYFAAPQDKKARKGYELLRRAIVDSGKVAVVRFALRSDIVHMGVLRAEGDLLVLQQMIWPEDVRKPEFSLLDEPVALTDKEVAMAGMLVESMAGEWVPGDWVDGYQERVASMVEAKAAGGDYVPVGGEAPLTDVSDLLSKLEASIQAKNAAKAPKKAAPKKKPAATAA